MRGIFVICALAVIAGAFATTHEDSYSQATDLIQDMKKKGATEADCKDLAKTTCKEVLSEVKKDQTVIDSQSSGIECNKLGVRAVEVAVKHYHKRVRQWTISKKTITKWATHKINLGVKTFISLKPGKCGFIFASRSYRSIYAKYHRAVKYERTVRGWVIEAKKAVVITKRSQKNQQEKCRCAVAKRRDTIWRTINTKKKRVRQAKALAKCKMMQCVLDGTPVNSKKCKGFLPVLKNKKLYHLVGMLSAARSATAATRRTKPRVRGRARSMLPREQRWRELPRRRRTRLLPRKGLPSAGGNKRLRLKPGSRKPSTMSDAARLQSVPQRSALAKLSVPTSTKLPWRAGSQFDHTRGMASSTTGIIT